MVDYAQRGCLTKEALASCGEQTDTPYDGAPYAGAAYDRAPGDVEQTDNSQGSKYQRRRRNKRGRKHAADIKITVAPAVAAAASASTSADANTSTTKRETSAAAAAAAASKRETSTAAAATATSKREASTVAAAATSKREASTAAAVHGTTVLRGGGRCAHAGHARTNSASVVVMLPGGGMRLMPQAAMTALMHGYADFCPSALHYTYCQTAQPRWLASAFETASVVPASVLARQPQVGLPRPPADPPLPVVDLPVHISPNQQDGILRVEHAGELCGGVDAENWRRSGRERQAGTACGVWEARELEVRALVPDPGG